MQINAEGLEIIRRFEGCKLKAYRCPAGILTIGFGHTGSDVTHGLTISQERAEELLRSDLARFERGVESLCPGLTPNRFSALVSFAFNCGLEALERSTLRRRVLAGDFAGAAAEFPRWNKAGGRALAGLIARRAEERALFERG